MPLQNDLLLRAANGELVERTPVWLMRQAGRILPEYRKLRAQAGDFKKMVETPELAAEATLQPINALGVDAAIIFSDILVVPQSMGLAYKIDEGRGPWFESPIQSDADIDRLHIATINDFQYVPDAIKFVKKELNGRVPLIGFAGAPWTIFSYMTEGAGSKTFSKAKKFLYVRPEASHKLLQKITDSTIVYLKEQIAAGVDIIQIFDSWAGALSPEQYREFSLKYISQICDAIGNVPVIVFAKGAASTLEDMFELNCRVIGLDWTMDIKDSRSLVGAEKTLQGNMDPCLLYADKGTIKKKTEEMLKAFGPRRHIANLGHGLYPDTDVDHVKCFVDTVKQFQFDPAKYASSFS